MKNGLLHKRIPTLFGLLLIVGGILVTSSLVKGNLSRIIKAAPLTTPENVVVSNVTSTAFTVSFTTQDTVLGTLRYSPDSSFNQTAFDDRDQKDNIPRPYTVHHITVQKLSPDTKYHFQIVSGGDTYTDLPLSTAITRAKEATTQQSEVTTVHGQIAKTDAQSLEALVYVKADTSQTLSAIVHTDGSYTIPLRNLFSEDLKTPVTLTDATPLTITVRTNSTTATAHVTVRNASAVPLITLSESYDFTQAGGFAAIDTVSSESAVAFPTYAVQAQKGTNNTPAITSPKQGDALSDQQPLIKGTAAPNQTVTITIHSDPIQATVTTDASGNWSYRPTTKLSPGTHTITILTRDALGVLKKVEQSFVVNAEGSQFTEPSVSPSQPTDTPTATAAPLLPTATGVMASPTPTTVFVPTASPTTIPTGIVGGPTNPPTPLTKFQTGNSPLLFGAIAGVVTFIIGSILFFLTRGSMSV